MTKYYTLFCILSVILVILGITSFISPYPWISCAIMTIIFVMLWCIADKIDQYERAVRLNQVQ